MWRKCLFFSENFVFLILFEHHQLINYNFCWNHNCPLRFFLEITGFNPNELGFWPTHNHKSALHWSFSVCQVHVFFFVYTCRKWFCKYLNSIILNTVFLHGWLRVVYLHHFFDYIVKKIFSDEANIGWDWHAQKLKWCCSAGCTVHSVTELLHGTDDCNIRL